jgi:hypothetical protein
VDFVNTHFSGNFFFFSRSHFVNKAVKNQDFLQNLTPKSLRKCDFSLAPQHVEKSFCLIFNGFIFCYAKKKKEGKNKKSLWRDPQQDILTKKQK